MKNHKCKEAGKIEISGNVTVIGRYAFIIENSLTGIAVYQDHQILFANSAFFKVFGEKTFSSFISKPFVEYLLPDSKELFQKKIAAQTIAIFEVQAYKKGESVIHLEMSLNTSEINGETYMQLSAIDITERIQAYEALKISETKLKYQNLEIDQKNKALKEILKQLSFEKKSLMDSIINNAELLIIPVLEELKLVVPENNKNLTNYVQILEKNINDLFSNFGMMLSSRTPQLTPREIEICNMIRHGMKTNDIAAQLSLSPLTVDTHRTRIRRKLGIEGKSHNLASFLRQKFNDEQLDINNDQ